MATTAIFRPIEAGRAPFNGPNAKLADPFPGHGHPDAMPAGWRCEAYAGPLGITAFVRADPADEPTAPLSEAPRFTVFANWRDIASVASDVAEVLRRDVLSLLESEGHRNPL